MEGKKFSGFHVVFKASRYLLEDSVTLNTDYSLTVFIVWMKTGGVEPCESSCG